MTDQSVYTYEGMFLFPQSATADLQAAVDHVKQLLARADAEILSFSKWDERRLAYEIKGNKRGVYFLTYFKADGSKLTELERACNLSEQFLRSMILRADEVPADQIEAADASAELQDEISLRGTQSERDTSESQTTTVVRKSEVAAEEAAVPTEVAPEPVASVSASSTEESTE